MFKRQRTGSLVCASCGSLVGVNDDKCYNCGRRNPGLWGFGPMLRAFGNDLGFVALVIYGCTALVHRRRADYGDARLRRHRPRRPALDPVARRLRVFVLGASGADRFFVVRPLVDGR